jgi:hypothetical protein
MIIFGSQAPIDPTEYIYTILGCVLGHHYKAFQWPNLVCSVPAEVSPEVSVQITKAPPLTLYGSQESLLLYPLILNQTNPSRVHSTHSTDTYAKLASTTYYVRPYPCRLMVVLFLWVVAPQTGP